jgi:hypothetical protein
VFVGRFAEDVVVKATRAKKAGASRPRAHAAASDQGRALPGYDDIAARAYELFLQRGGEHGHDRDDWLSAERQLLSAKLRVA